MLTDEQVMEQYVRMMTSGGDFSSSFAPDVLWTTMESGEQVRGREAVRDRIQHLRRQAFDARIEVVRTVVDGSTAVLEAVLDGTHTGQFGGMPATGAHVRLPYTMAYEFADGQITELRAYLSSAALREQVAAGAPARQAPA